MSELHTRLVDEIAVRMSWQRKAEAAEQELNRRNASTEAIRIKTVEIMTERDQLKARVVELERQRDQAIHEANRTSQKWMDGINEIVGRKLDYSDPCGKDNASKVLGDLIQGCQSALKESKAALEETKLGWNEWLSLKASALTTINKALES